MGRWIGYWWICFCKRTSKPRSRSFWTWMRPMIRCMATRKGGSFTATTDTTATCRCISFVESSCYVRACAPPTSMRRRAAWTSCSGLSPRFAHAGPRCALSSAQTRAFAERIGWPGVKPNRWIICWDWPKRTSEGRDSDCHDRSRSPVSAERTDGTGVPPVPVSDARELESGPAGGGQGGVHGKRRESALHRNLPGCRTLAGAALVRKALLRPGRHGKPHQRTTDAVLRSHQHRLSAQQSVAPVLLFAGLCPAADAAAIGAAGNRVGQGAMRHHSAEAAQDRRPDPHQRTQGVGLAGRGLSLCRLIPASACQALGSSPPLLNEQTRSQTLALIPVALAVVCLHSARKGGN